MNSDLITHVRFHWPVSPAPVSRRFDSEEGQERSSEVSHGNLGGANFHQKAIHHMVVQLNESWSSGGHFEKQPPAVLVILSADIGTERRLLPTEPQSSVCIR
jgi:hypothetical protein